MANLSRALLQLVSAEDINKIERIDAREVTSNPDRYVKDNLLGYYILINTWLMMIKQFSEYGWKFVLTHIMQHGLFKAIKEFDSAASEIVRGEEITFSIARTLLADVKSTVPINGIPIDTERNVTHDPMAAALMLFRYPKRFSPVGADKLRDTGIETFIQVQKRMKLWQRQPHSLFVMERVREEASQLLNWGKLVCELNDVDISDIVFTPGVSFDTSAKLLSKLQSLAKEHVEYFYMPFGIPLVANRGEEETSYDASGHEIHPVRLVAVPKNYKTARIIAPENVYRQALARRYFNISDSYLPSLIKLHDQTQNQQLALNGSVDGQLATIDLSSASDSVTLTLLFNILPPDFMDIMIKVLPTHYDINGSRRLLQSAATMGNSMTFWLESVVFASIALAAVRFYNRMTGEDDETVSVYGDDIIVPTDAAPTVMEWLEECGFTVNIDKSFFSREHKYRESCGEEYFQGINVSSKYFPRFPIEGTLGSTISDKFIRDGFTGTIVDTMSALVDLQHKMFLTCIPAALLLQEVISSADHRMTFSTPDEGFSDIWSYESYPKIIPAPSGEWVDGTLKRTSNSLYPRSGHLTPITVYEEPKDQKDEILVSLYNYQNFLKFGPKVSDDPVLKLLGITEPPISYKEAASVPKVRWVYIK